jgi:hypothetical protein
MLSQNLHGFTEENEDNPMPRNPVSRTKVETGPKCAGELLPAGSPLDMKTVLNFWPCMYMSMLMLLFVRSDRAHFYESKKKQRNKQTNENQLSH